MRTRIVYENIFVKTIKDVHVHETKSYLFVKIKHHLVRDPSRITFWWVHIKKSSVLLVQSLLFFVNNYESWTQMMSWTHPDRQISQVNSDESWTQMMRQANISTFCSKKKSKKYHNVGTIPKSNRKIIASGKINTPTHKCMNAHL